MDWPRVSIITPSLNQGEYLEQTIQSVIQQNYPNLEYIVIDGGSNDQSLDIIRKYEPWLAYWISEKDAGQSDAINKGFRHVTGDYIAWLNSDDLYLPDCLQKIVSTFLSHPEAGMVVGQVEVINETGARIGLFEPVSRFNYIDLLTLKTILPQQAAMFSRETYENVGPIRNDLHYAMDVDYFIRIGSHFSIIPLTETLARFRLSDTNKSIANRTRWPAEFVKIVDDFFNQPGLDPNMYSLRSQAFGGAYYRGAATFLECLELDTARKWFIKALRENPYYAIKPGWWKNILKTFLGKALNNKLLELKVLLRKKNLIVNEQDWQTGVEFNRNQKLTQPNK